MDSTADNIKDLIDALNAFLLEKKAEGRKVILLIDEAQNLSKDVLEQLRLLSNLETTTSKLLQIILVGQPELGEMLDSHELRQLGQRITLSCHLSPLTFRETREYILHRLRVASRKEVIQFALPAIRIIHRYSGGIPRLINIACDRALLTAFGLNSRRVNAGIARSATRELADRRSVKRLGTGLQWRPYIAAGVLCLVFLFAGYYYRGAPEPLSGVEDRVSEAVDRVEAPPTEASLPGEGAKAFEDVQTRAPKAGEEVQEVRKAEKLPASPAAASRVATVDELDRRIGGVAPALSRRSALKAALKLWLDDPVVNPYLDAMEEDPDAFRFAARQNGLSVHWARTNLAFLKKLNLPAILRMEVPGGVAPRYLTLSRLHGEMVTLLGGRSEKEAIETGQDVLFERWSGDAYIFWKNFLNCEGTLPKAATRESVITLKMLLQDIGFQNMTISPHYDQAMQDAVEAVQKRNGIMVDGIVGPITKIVLYNEKKGLRIPHIHSDGDKGETSRRAREETTGDG